MIFSAKEKPMGPENRVFTAGARTENATVALAYWETHPDLTLYVGARDGYAVVNEEWGHRCRWAGWHQTSPEEIEAMVAE
jgi:hypothetical protein